MGGGHAGLEAAFAAARLGGGTLLVTQSLDSIGVLSCNPAFGGPAKGTLLCEVDALGGYSASGADASAIQCRILGESKGPAARATRNLVDRARYSYLAKEHAKREKGLTLIQGEAARVLAQNGRATGIALVDGRVFECGAIVLTGGTFWNGRVYHGLESNPGGRVGEPPATHLKDSLCSLGHRLTRLSTSTAPRLIASTVDTSDLVEQPGDPESRPFSVLSGGTRNLVSCHLTWTNPKTHKIVLDNLGASIIFAEKDRVSTGPRYCPSLEDKVVAYPERERHQIFLEQDGPEHVYPSGLPTGLAPKVQQQAVNTIKGLERAIIGRPGYAIEYDVSDPRDLTPALESKFVKGLFMAGQVNGTSGYEEAAAQGVWAGVSAALRASGGDPVFLGRDQALMGVMMDDLTVQGVSEPYRMFSSRAEWRLCLREDNADLRLSPIAGGMGLLDPTRAELLKQKQAAMERGKALLAQGKVTPSQAEALGNEHGIQRDSQLAEPMRASEFLRRPLVKLRYLEQLFPQLSEISPDALRTLEIELKFEGYLEHQRRGIERMRRLEGSRIPEGMDFRDVPGLTREAIESLSKAKPDTLGQAGRLRGVTPASVSALSVFIRKKGIANI
ncbi:MAG: tRNA uridine-5-carboxymethylaminomethyl(34) synthesis enzyme MnmG [Deltaproteobacteria bacterium]|nr:tRNA uridine-5-carboxymethylaminomethyl(34) synthesis enzyme MnmG [Deltaproteobacteria bacterium]